MKEIDDFLPRWVTPALSPRGYRKSSHTYRKHFESGDWGVFSFRGFPLTNVRGSFVADASFVPGPLFDWFNYAHPGPGDEAANRLVVVLGQPTVIPARRRLAVSTDAERDICGGLLVDRLAEVAPLFDRFAAEPDLLVSLALTQEHHDCDELPLSRSHLQHPTWRAALLIRRVPSPELEQALTDADGYPLLLLRQWTEHYLMSNGA